VICGPVNSPDADQARDHARKRRPRPCCGGGRADAGRKYITIASKRCWKGNDPGPIRRRTARRLCSPRRCRAELHIVNRKGLLARPRHREILCSASIGFLTQDVRSTPLRRDGRGAIRSWGILTLGAGPGVDDHGYYRLQGPEAREVLGRAACDLFGSPGRFGEDEWTIALVLPVRLWRYIRKSSPERRSVARLDAR